LCNFNRGKPAYKVLDVTAVNVCNQLLDSQYMHDVDFWGISLGCVEACSQHVNCSCVVNKALVAGKRPLKKDSIPAILDRLAANILHCELFVGMAAAFSAAQ